MFTAYNANSANSRKKPSFFFYYFDNKKCEFLNKIYISENYMNRSIDDYKRKIKQCSYSLHKLQTKNRFAQPQIGVLTMPQGSPGQRCIPGRQPGTPAADLVHKASQALPGHALSLPISLQRGLASEEPYRTTAFSLGRCRYRRQPSDTSSASARGPRPRFRVSARGSRHPDPLTGRATVCWRKLGGSLPGQHLAPPEGGRCITPFSSPEAD